MGGMLGFCFCSLYHGATWMLMRVLAPQRRTDGRLGCVSRLTRARLLPRRCRPIVIRVY